MFEIAQPGLKDWIKYTMGVGAPPDDMLDKLIAAIPESVTLYIDQCATVAKPIRQSGDRRSAQIELVQSAFREFPSGKIIGKFIARLCAPPTFKVMPIGNVMFPDLALDKADYGGVGYGNDYLEAGTAAIKDYLSKGKAA